MSGRTLPPFTQKILGIYELLKPLGEGGMGRVFLARQRTTGAQVVVKLMREERARDPAFRRIFESELRVMMKFHHPNAVALLDASPANEAQPYLVLEYVPGMTLEALLEREGRLQTRRVGPLLAGLCLVLQAAHDRGILHRDISSANVMIANAGTAHESVKVMDFGLARLGGGFYIALEKLQNADAGIGGGTPDYVSPEQVRGEEVDHRSDLYSVGVLLFEALTGHFPFESEREVQAILLAHRDKEPPSFMDVNTFGVPRPIEAVVRACLAKDPAARPQSARELAERFGAALGRPIIDPRAFDAQAAQAPPPEEATPAFAPDTVIDRFDAWMPEQIAVMKLRGFIQGVGGEVLESLPGLIRVRLRGTAPEQPKGLSGWFKTAAPPPPPGETIELHLQKKPSSGRSLVDIAVVRPKTRAESRQARAAGSERCRATCRELRAYLMIDR
jgi:serine/threonine-protein kinase